MLRSLFTGISGLKAHQTMLDVTSNNIANANTAGYKSSSTVFEDTLSQMLTDATDASTPRGGTNPVQIGLGTRLAATSLNLIQGSAQVTGRNTDLMLQGDGMFVVKKNGVDFYTRAGSFTFDNQGKLVTPQGSRVQGYALDNTGKATGTPIDISLATAAKTGPPAVPASTPATNPALPADVELRSFSFGADGKLRGVYSDGKQYEMAQLAIADFKNPMGLEKVGETAFRATANSGPVDLSVAQTGRRGTVVGGAIEMSNVDLATEFTNMILAQRGFQANSRVITTSDSVLEETVNLKR